MENIEKIGFEFADNVPLFKVKVNGAEKSFLLDTGSAYMVLNGKYENDANVKEVAGITDNFHTGAKFIALFEWGGLRLTNQIAMIADINHLEEHLNLKIHGLIGCAQMMNYDLLLDYSEQYVSLVDSYDEISYKKIFYGEIPECINNFISIPFIMSNHIPVIPVKIDMKTFSMGLDTGASLNVLDKKHIEFLQGTGLLYDIKHDDVLRFNAENTERGAFSCAIKTVGIGDLLLNDMRFYLHDIGLPQIKADGLLGYEFFCKQQVFIRFAKRELLLKDYH
jgi:predicted aspartyl protease